MKNVLQIAICIVLTACGGTTSNFNSNISTNTAQKTGESVHAAETVTINSPDGLILTGTFLAANKPDSPALLLLHQWQSDRHSYDDFAKRMQARGFSVLSIDGRGFGESTKKADGSNVSAERTDEAVRKMLGDVGAAFDFLTRQRNVDPARIGVVGASYGSSLAIIYAADNPKVAAVALLSPGLNYFGNMQTEPAVAKYGGGRPLLFVAAKDDPDSADAVVALISHAAHDGQWGEMVYDTGGHGTGLFKTQLDLGDVLERFFTERLEISKT